MKYIEWAGPEREIPGYGMGRKGARLLLPTDMADSYISQGLAKVPSEPTRLKKADKIEEKANA